MPSRIPMWQNVLLIALFGLAALLIVGNTVADLRAEFFPTPVAHSDPIYTNIEKLIAFDYRDAGTPTEYVYYSYLGEPMPEKLDPLEVKSMRNASSYTVRLSTPEEESKTGKYRMEYRGLPQPTYYDKDGTWFYMLYATTSPAAFKDAQYSNPMAYLFGRVAYGASLASGYGFTFRQSAVSLATARTNPADNTANSFEAEASCTTGPIWTIQRLFLPYDTSSIPVSADVSGTSVFLEFTGASTNNMTDSLASLVGTTQATHTTLGVNDHASVGATDYAPDDDIMSPTGFVLNATGIAAIKKNGQASACSATAGITCLGVRLTGDLSGGASLSAINCPSNPINRISGLGSLPTLYSPYLASFQPWKFWEF